MITIAERSLPTVYADGLSLLLLLGVFALSYKSRTSRKRDLETVLFCLLGAAVALNAVFSGLFYVLRDQSLGWSPFLSRILPTLDELSATFVLAVFVFYAEYRIHGSRERLLRYRYILALPALVVAAFTIINLFTGWMITVDENMLLHYTPLYFILEAVEYLYGLMPLVDEILYTGRFGKLHFFSVIPVVVPVTVASLFTVVSDYSLSPLGFSVGVLLLFLSYASKWRFDDHESGLYNRHFLKFILELALAGKIEYKNVIIFQTDHASKAFFDILKTELPREGELIRTDKNTVMLFSGNSTPSALSVFSSLVQDAADEYNDNHPDENALDIIVSTRRRRKNESTAEFVKRMYRAAAFS